MSDFFKSKGRLALAMGALFLVVTLISGGVAYLLTGDSQPSSTSSEPPIQQEEPQQELPEVVPAITEPIQEEMEEEQLAKEEPVHFNIPTEMRGVMLAPGVEYSVVKDATEATIKQQIAAALDHAKNLTMNTVIIQTGYHDGVIYHTQDAPALFGDLDIMEYIVQQCRTRGLYTYAVFDMAYYRKDTGLFAGSETLNKVTGNLREFAEKYALDGVLIDGYLNQNEETSYLQYLGTGGGIGFDNYMRQSPQAVVKTASNTIRSYAKGTQVGLLADSVWENATANELGSNTKASFTAFGNGNADTKGFVEQELVDFVAVEALGSLTDSAVPFKEVVSWWSAVAAQNQVPLYVVHAADKICTDQPGWQPHDQITKQVIEASSFQGYQGSIFNTLSRLVENPKDASATLVKYYNNEVEAAHILTELAITKPDKATFTTFEPIVTFTGASDPNSKVTINGEEIATDASGYFTLTMDLKAGENKFTIEHKEKIINYNITRVVQILKEISPTGNIATEGGMSITVSAWAYSDAKVYAKIGGQTIPMSIDDSMETEAERDSTYKQFFGEFTAPAATGSEQNLGNIVVHASWGGETDSMQGAFVKVNKKAKVEDGVAVVVTAAQAKTYPPDTLNNIPSPNYYPIPAGAMDYAVGEEIVYKKDKNTYTYFVLASGLRVESKDITASGDYASGNVISGLEVTSDGGYTYVKLKTAQKVSYRLSYTGSAVNVKFHYTSQVPQSSKVGKNPLFTAAQWKDSTLTLPLTKQGCFMGYKGYYDDSGNLVLQFNNPPSSLANARIAIDAGHGGGDNGAKGFLADYPEKVINLGIAQKLAEELQRRGATVLLINNSGNPSLESRVGQAEKWNADMLISVHSNSSASNSGAVGTEVYYFYPFSGTLAATTAKNVSNQFNTSNRGGKQSYYHVTLSSQFSSVLVECGFVSNKTEYEKLIKSKNQGIIASAIADSIAIAIKAAYPGSGGDSGGGGGGGLFEPIQDDINHSGSEDTESGIPIFRDDTQDTANTVVEEVSLSDTQLSMEVDEQQRLRATVSPLAADQRITWKSSNTSVAMVDENGRITALRPGTAIISAISLGDNSIYDQCEVTVE